MKLESSCYHEGSYHIETSPLICRSNQWSGFYMTETSVMRELIMKEKFWGDPQSRTNSGRKFCSKNEYAEAVTRSVLLKKYVLQISQIPQESICTSFFFNNVTGLRPATLLKKRLKLKSVNYFRKNLHLRYLSGLWKCFWRYIQLLGKLKIPIQQLVIVIIKVNTKHFLKETKESMSICFHRESVLD